MADVTIMQIKKLREATNAGMMDCKKALEEAAGDFDAAVDWLRAKGLSAAAKKSGRVAAQGLVCVNVQDNKGSIVELNAETDFVSRNEQFQVLLSNITKISLNKNIGDIEKLQNAQYLESDKNVQEAISDSIAVIGENIKLRRAAVVEVSQGVLGHYVHNTIAPNMGQIGVIVSLESTSKHERLEALANELAMHIAASKPEFISVEEVKPENIEREKQIFMEQIQDSGKPANLIEKMVEGRIGKYYDEVVLLEQEFVMESKTKIKTVLERTAKEIGEPVKIASFVRFTLGEGIEQDVSNFAEEVANMAKK